MDYALLKQLQSAIDDLLKVPGVRPVLAAHLRALADTLVDGAEEATAAGETAVDENAVEPNRADGDDDEQPNEPDKYSPSDTPHHTITSKDVERLRNRNDWGPGNGVGLVVDFESYGIPPQPDTTLDKLAARFQLKADAADHLARGDRSALAEQRDCEIALGTRLWFTDLPDVAAPSLEHLARAYAAAHQATVILRDCLPSASEVELSALFDSAAQASSLLTGSVMRARDNADPSYDPDARDLNGWLRYLTNERKVFQNRYLTLDSMAPLRSIDECLNSLADLAARGEYRRKQERVLAAIRYHVRQCIQNIDFAFHGQHHRERLVAKVCDAEEAGMAASSRALRDELLPAHDILPRPDDAPVFYNDVLVYLDEDAERLDKLDDASLSTEDDGPTSPLVARARELLKGRALLLVGGVPVPEAARRIQNAFNLAEVIWPETRVHQSPEPLRHPIYRDDVAAVVQLIRFSGHGFGDLRADCKSVGKPFVRVVGGFGVKSIAYGIVEQASRTLAEAQPPGPSHPPSGG